MVCNLKLINQILFLCLSIKINFLFAVFLVFDFINNSRDKLTETNKIQERQQGKSILTKNSRTRLNILKTTTSSIEQNPPRPLRPRVQFSVSPQLWSSTVNLLSLIANLLGCCRPRCPPTPREIEMQVTIQTWPDCSNSVGHRKLMGVHAAKEMKEGCTFLGI